MLQKVLKEDYAVEFRDYGIITIPKGTMADQEAEEEPHIGYYPIAEFDWIAEKYPEQSKTMKADVLEYGIFIPKEKLTEALRLRFLYDDCGSCRDIYKDIYGKKKYCRMESRIDRAAWYTITDDWEEPDCPLKANLFIQLIGKSGKVVVTEQQADTGDESAIDGIFPFSWEKPQTKKQEECMKLIYDL